MFDDGDHGFDGLTNADIRAGDYAMSWQVNRARFDQMLLEHAKSLGATVHEETTALAPIMWSLRVRSADGEREMHADVVVDAAGTPLGRASTTKRTSRPPPTGPTSVERAESASRSVEIGSSRSRRAGSGSFP